MIKYCVHPTKSFNEMIDNFYVTDFSKKNCKEITFQVTENCCLNCSYCYQLHKTNKKMDFNTAKKFIDILLSDQFERINTKNALGLSVHFIGGEPLMEIKLIQEIWEYLINEMIRLNHPWLYTTRGDLCSNGVPYFNPEVQKFFKKYHNFFSFSISIDGNKELHDACRVDYNGNGSYDIAMAAVRHYYKSYGIMPGVKMTLSPENIHYTKDAVINLISEGYTNIFLNCIYEEGWNWSHANILYSKMIELADYVIENNLNEKVYISLFEENMFIPYLEEDEPNWCGGVGDVMFAIDPQGDYYTCIRYMESSLNGEQRPLKLGSVNTGYLTTKEEQENYNLLLNITRNSQSSEECLNCPVAQGCAWCSGYNYQKFGTPNKRATYICCMHKARALANSYYWNKIYFKYNIDKVFPNYLPLEEQQMILKGEK